MPKPVRAVIVPHVPERGANISGHRDSVACIAEERAGEDGHRLEILSLHVLVGSFEPAAGEDHGLACLHLYRCAITHDAHTAHAFALAPDQTFGRRVEMNGNASLCDIVFKHLEQARSRPHAANRMHGSRALDRLGRW